MILSRNHSNEVPKVSKYSFHKIVTHSLEINIDESF
jgi:hypothetical protein